MVQNALVLVNFIGVFLLHLFFGGSATVTHTIPAQVQVDNEQEFNIRISKGDAQGFAKLQMDFTADVSIKPVDVKGASYSYENNTLKLIWMSIPSDADFTVKLTMKPGLSADAKVKGKFSYLENNQRTDVDIPEYSFKISDGKTQEHPVAQQTPPDPVKEEKPATTQQTPPATTPLASGGSSVTCTRTVVPSGDKEFIVHLDINKGSVSSFARVEDVLPKGFKAQSIENKGGTFNFVDNKAKFVWMALPGDQSFRVSYKLIAQTAPAGNYNIMGDFSYIENDQTQKLTIAPSTVRVEAPAQPVAETPREEKKDDVAQVPVQQPKQAPVQQQPVANVGAPQKGIVYRVQVAAGRNNVERDYFSKVHNFGEDLIIENHEGWIKYTTGRYDVYAQARDKRETVNAGGHNFDGPFVTAYNEGQRITVQEALMITNQKWLP
jgi:hypothetical protein